MSKNEKLLESFTAYCKMYPELRFWQALRGWAEVSFLITSDTPPHEIMDSVNAIHEPKLEDTFYWEDKNN